MTKRRQRVLTHFLSTFFSKEYINFHLYAIATHPSDVIRFRAAKRPSVDASKTERVSRFRSEYSFCVISAASILIFGKLLLVQLTSLVFCVYQCFLVTDVMMRQVVPDGGCIL